MSNDTETLVRRVEKLECQNRWMKWSGLVVLLGIVSVFFYGASAGKKVVEAEEFRLVDTKGKCRGSFEVTDDSTHGLNLYDENGTLRITLAVLWHGPALGLYDENGKTRVNLTISKGNPVLALYDENGKGGGQLKADGLAFYDGNGNYLPSSPRSLPQTYQGNSGNQSDVEEAVEKLKEKEKHDRYYNECHYCKGLGVVKCSYCEGKGGEYKVLTTLKASTYWDECSYCGGTGLEKCSYCKGRGYTE
jgi:hypothetical protein